MSEHGTRARYAAGCHCKPCTRANTEYIKDHRKGLAGIRSHDDRIDTILEELHP